MEISKAAEKYKKELQSLAENLPFKDIVLPEWENKTFKITHVRQKRTYQSADPGTQAIGRFLVERGMVELLAPADTSNLFKEIYWSVYTIRNLSNKKYSTPKQWKEALVKARGLISQLEAAEEELFIANRRLVVSCVKPFFWIGQVWIADFLQEGSKALSNAVRKFDFTRGTPFYAYAQKAVQNRLRNFFSRSCTFGKYRNLSD